MDNEKVRAAMQENVAQDPLVEVLDHAFGEIDGGKPDADDASVLRVAFEHFGYHLASTPQPEIKALVEALEFYADADGDGYQAYPADYGLSMDLGDIIKDGGERASKALAAHHEARP